MRSVSLAFARLADDLLRSITHLRLRPERRAVKYLCRDY